MERKLFQGNHKAMNLLSFFVERAPNTIQMAFLPQSTTHK